LRICNFSHVVLIFSKLKLQSFDIDVIFKDWSREPIHISAVPSKALDFIEPWLEECEIPFYLGSGNLKWKAIIREILTDSLSKEEWEEDGGWDAFFDELEEESSNDSDEDSDEVIFVDSSSLFFFLFFVVLGGLRLWRVET